MTDLLKKALGLVTGKAGADKQRPLRSLSERDLIELESEIGRHVFGAVPEGHRREFFCLDEHTWVWYEAWKEGKVTREQTTRYEVHADRVLKVRDGGHYQYLDNEEMQNFGLAVRLYYEQVMRGIYKRDPYTGEVLTGRPATIEDNHAG